MPIVTCDHSIDNYSRLSVDRCRSTMVWQWSGSSKNQKGSCDSFITNEKIGTKTLVWTVKCRHQIDSWMSSVRFAKILFRIGWEVTKYLCSQWKSFLNRLEIFRLHDTSLWNFFVVGAHVSLIGCSSNQFFFRTQCLDRCEIAVVPSG